MCLASQCDPKQQKSINHSEHRLSEPNRAVRIASFSILYDPLLIYVIMRHSSMSMTGLSRTTTYVKKREQIVKITSRYRGLS